MTIAYRAKATSTTATGSTMATSGGVTAVNDYLLATFHFDNHTSGVHTSVASISDGNGNTWTKLASSSSAESGNFQSTEIWGAVNLAGTAVSVTATLTNPTRDASSMAVQSFSGVDVNFPIAAPFVFTTNYTGSNASPTTSVTVSSDNPLIVAGLTSDAGVTTPTNETGWTNTVTISTGTFTSQYIDVIAQAAKGTYSTTWNPMRGAVYIGALRASGSFATALDGSASATSSTAGTSISATLTTTALNDVVVAIVTNVTSKTNPAITCTSITGTNGLTWTRRSINTMVSTENNMKTTVEVFYAVAASVLSAKTIVANFSASCDNGITVFGVNGANTSSPWDPSSGAVNKNLTSSSPSLTRLNPNPLTTVNADDFVFAFCVNDDTNSMAVGALGGVASAALGTVRTNISGLFAFQFLGEYRNVGAPLTSADAIFQSGSSANWIVLADALTAGASVSNATGTITTALSKASFNTQAKESFPATIVTRLTKASFALNGTARFEGTILTRLTKASFAALGNERFSGTIVTNLQGISQRASSPGNNTGTIVTALRFLDQVIRGEERFLGSVTTNLSKASFTALQAQERFVGQITTNLRPINFAASAEERFAGYIVTQLGKANALVQTDVQGMLIILGDITTHLGPANVLSLGALLGSPGQGKWYSFRYLDS